MSTSDDPNKTALLALRKVEGNEVCADCRQKDPEWVDTKFGVFICISCSGIHRGLGAHLATVKSPTLNTISDEDITLLTELGNRRANETWEADVPDCCRPPCSTDSLICREQWIRAKYERKEFVLDANDDRTRPYITGTRKGFLFKKKKVDNVWQSRFFVLDEECLSYYKRLADQHPTESIPITDMNVTMNGQTGHPNAMQITAIIRGKTRNYFVYAENGKDIIWWYFAIRAARLKLLRSMYPEKSISELKGIISRDFIKAGYLHKTPANKLQKFQKRYFILDLPRLMYFEKPTDAFPLGEIVIGSANEGFSVDENAPDDLGGGENAFVFNTTTRTYPLLAETREDKQAWVEVLRSAIDNPAPNGHSINVTYNTE